MRDHIYLCVFLVFGMREQNRIMGSDSSLCVRLHRNLYCFIAFCDFDLLGTYQGVHTVHVPSGLNRAFCAPAPADGGVDTPTVSAI